MNISKFNHFHRNFHLFHAFYLPFNTPKSVLTFFKHKYFITGRCLVKMGLLWAADLSPKGSPRGSPRGSLPGRSSKRSNWLQDIPSAVQALQVCARRDWMMRDSPFASICHHPSITKFSFEMRWLHDTHNPKNCHIPQMVSTLCTKFVCLYIMSLGRTHFTDCNHFPQGIIRGINWGGLAFFMRVAVSDL